MRTEPSPKRESVNLVEEGVLQKDQVTMKDISKEEIGNVETEKTIIREEIDED